MKNPNIISLALLFTFLVTATSSAQEKRLKFNDNHKFKIVQLTDIHWKYGNPDSDIAATRINEILDAEEPDLVVVTGDIVFAKPAAEGIKAALEPITKRNIPFAVTFGNHDDEQDLSRKELLDIIRQLPGNLTSTTEGITGTTNYILPVMSSNGERQAAALYIFDSNSYSTTKKVKGYGWIEYDQIDWYLRRSAEFTKSNKNTPLPSLAFFHIPIPEYHEAVTNEGAFIVGTRKERACAPEINTGLGAAMLKSGDVMGIFVGHDHVNDYAVDWRGILLCYGRYSGGNTVYNNIPNGNGARIIELTEDFRNFQTWIRIKDNQVLNMVSFPEDTK
jgi:predicted MPP superfamily phosphohydrolase